MIFTIVIIVSGIIIAAIEIGLLLLERSLSFSYESLGRYVSSIDKIYRVLLECTTDFY